MESFSWNSGLYLVCIGSVLSVI